MPVDITFKYVSSPEGRTFFYQHWLPENPKALVVFVHELGDHIGRYNNFASRLVSDGFACAMFDQRGHGKSEGKRGHIGRFHDLVNDLVGFVQFSLAQVPKDTPLYLVGHGLGALVGLDYTLVAHERPLGSVTISPTIDLSAKIAPWKEKMATRLQRALPTVSFNSGMWTDAASGNALLHNCVTAGGFCEIKEATHKLTALAPRIYSPILVLVGADDVIADPKISRDFASRVSSADKQYQMYASVGHDLLCSVGNEKVTTDIVTWMTEKLHTTVSPGRQYELNRREPLWQGVSASL